MTRIILLTIINLLGFFFKCSSQSIFIQRGRIDFERRVSVHKEIVGTSFEPFKSTIPTFFVTNHQLFFNSNETLYQFNEGIQNDVSFLRDIPTINDKIYTNLESKSFKQLSTTSDTLFTVSDQLSPIRWKIKSELREIAGFECVKAEAILDDSIFVIAFFCPQITVSGGPMRFSGLPGMILGVVIPRLNLTLFATKLSLNENANLVQPLSLKGLNINAITYKRKIDQETLKVKDNLKNGLLRRLY